MTDRSIRYAVRDLDEPTQSELEREAASVSTVERIAPTAIGGVMSPEQSAAWNSWVDDRIDLQVMSAARSLSREAGKQELALRSEFRASIEAVKRDLDVLREQNVALKVELAVLRGSQDRGGEILDLPALLSKRAKLNG